MFEEYQPMIIDVTSPTAFGSIRDILLSVLYRKEKEYRFVSHGIRLVKCEEYFLFMVRNICNGYSTSITNEKIVDDIAKNIINYGKDELERIPKKEEYRIPYVSHHIDGEENLPSVSMAIAKNMESIQKKEDAERIRDEKQEQQIGIF